jgi:hypothetical protein
MLEGSRLVEVEYVLVHSSTASTLTLAIAGEILAGTRPRISFAPMVITTGNLMAHEVVGTLCGRASSTDYRGWFFNPHVGRIERPRAAFVAVMRRAMVRRWLRRAVHAVS